MPKPIEMHTTEPLRVVRTTEKAVLFDKGPHTVPFWVPKSMIEEPDEEEFTPDAELEITIPLWLAQEKELA